MTKVLIIAEAGVNHKGDFEKAKKLIDVAMITPPAIITAIFLNKFMSFSLMFQI